MDIDCTVGVVSWPFGTLNSGPSGCGVLTVGIAALDVPVLTDRPVGVLVDRLRVS